jgi:uncharacterized membrane protein YqjE
MKKKSKLEFDIMCDECEDSFQKETKTEIIIAREIVQKHLKNEKGEVENKQLQLLAEAREDDAISCINTMMSMMSMCISALALFLSIMEAIVQSWFTNSSELVRVTMIVIIVITVIVIGGSWKMNHSQNKYNNVSKWRKYLLIVLEQENIEHKVPSTLRK